MPASKLAGYEKAYYRDHGPRYEDSADMEPASQPLYAGQAQVPRLPVPPLEHTMELLVRSVEPHVTPEELAETKRKVAAFMSGLGPELQKRLLAHKEAHPNTSWFAEWWNRAAYLGYRDSIVWNVTYYLQFKDEFPAGMLRPTRRAARFLLHALTYRDLVVSGNLAPDMKGKTPMSNSQHKYLYNACRMPGPNQMDFVRTYAPDLYGHIVVMRKNRVYAIDVLDPATGKALTLNEIQAQLDRVVAMADRLGTDPHPVGILTADNRDVWYNNREMLVNGLSPEMCKQNAGVLECIESAILAICLDDTAPVTRKDTGHQLLHSDGCNRFWDKPAQVVFFENGKGGFVGEHAMMDGLTTTRMVNFCLDKLFEDSEETISGACPKSVQAALPEPTPLTFALDQRCKAAIAQSRQTFEDTLRDKELSVLMFYGYGKNLIKSFKVSPDAYAQLAIQYTYYRTFGTVRGTYESTQTRSFLHGRTEVTRSVSNESKAFCEAMTAGAPLKECYDKLVAATKYHSSFSGKAGKGMGVDRHLFGLKMMLKEGESAEIFSDIGTQRSSTWALSTSGLVGENMDNWGFGEVVPHGIGVGYGVLANRLRFTFSSRHKWVDTLTANMEQSLLEMQQLCQLFATPPPRSKL